MIILTDGKKKKRGEKVLRLGLLRTVSMPRYEKKHSLLINPRRCRKGGRRFEDFGLVDHGGGKSRTGSFLLAHGRKGEGMSARPLTLRVERTG